jgi:hypothetical protein
MPAKKPRIKVTFEASTVVILSSLAHQAHQSVAGLVRELALEALEMREDYDLSKVAEKSDIHGTKTYPHEDAWK